MKRYADHLSARLTRMPVSTWSMIKWAAVVPSDLMRVASKSTKMNAVKGAHSWCNPMLLCKHDCHQREKVAWMRILMYLSCLLIVESEDAQ